MKYLGHAVIAALTCSLAAAPSSASIVLHQTRVVYPADARDVTVAAENNGPAPVLVQAWLDGGDPTTPPDKSDAPFTLTPPLFRLDPKSTQSLRLIYSGARLPTDRESLFWLNVLEIPSVRPAGENKLQIIFRTRIKVFFRPVGLRGAAAAAPAQIQWTLQQKPEGGVVLHASNPSAYHVNFNSIEASVAGKKYEINGGMVRPGESTDFPLNELKSIPIGNLFINYSYIDDYGANVSGRSP